MISAIRDAAADATCATASSAAASVWERGHATIPGKCLRLGGIEYYIYINRDLMRYII